jgi:hypothetical protein
MKPPRRSTTPLGLRLEGLLDPDLESLERTALLRLMLLFAERPPPPDPNRCFPEFPSLEQRWLAAIDRSR